MSRSVEGCVFCAIVAGTEPSEQVYQDEWAIGIVPLNPVVRGHLLAIPRDHAADFTESWLSLSNATHAAFQMARTYMHGDCNLITSKGRAATQSVFHLHIHIVPRYENDGLALPWYSGKTKRLVPTDV